MKTAIHWTNVLLQCGTASAYTEVIEMVQEDALRHAADEITKTGEAIRQDDPWTGEPKDGTQEEAELYFAIAENILGEVNKVHQATLDAVARAKRESSLPDL